MYHPRIARAALPVLAAALCIVIPMATASASEEPAGCRDTCPTPYGAVTRSVVRVAGDCIVRITWRARPSCSVGWDILVLSVEPLVDGCGGRSIASLVDEATDSLCASPETGLYVMAGFRDSCVEIGRVRRAACWRERAECGDTLLVPCDTTSCCESIVLLCTDVIFRRRIVRGPSTLRAPCDPGSRCESFCGPPDSSDQDDGWDPPDTLAPRPQDGAEVSSRPMFPYAPTVGVLGRLDAMSFAVRSCGPFGPATAELVAKSPRPSWPWRDRRPLRSPTRDVREPTWMLALARRATGDRR